MDVTFNCPICGKRLALEDSVVGRQIQCPYCNGTFLLNREMVQPQMPQQTLPVGMGRNEYRQPPRDTVTFEVCPIGFWARVVAAFVDSIVTFIVAIIVGFAIGIVMGVLGIGDAGLIGNLIGICVSWLYCALMEASELQATLGNLVIGAKVVDANSERLTFGRATGRHFAKYLSALLLCIGYIMAAFDERKRALHDMIAGTYVISRLDQ
jgi:uncharacterized RDD family membrane protein YckC/DNA-directed RNA polymerase subunit RPC12/RpoP